jgi:transposase-like protein
VVYNNPGGNMGKRKRYTAEEKVRILREVLEDGKSISQAAEQ